MVDHRILRRARRDEVKRTILREAEARYRHELLDDEERLLLLERVLRLRRDLRREFLSGFRSGSGDRRASLGKRASK